ncbi:DNA-3-methyladenine glycosylase [Terriglobus roseus DSM 18391]|uniref:Putative 3-methyladenine DNA glycosylase n=1 Tax=Terriglobus roseus (strain DSM 18391 / NRRL B-41598 / KBS 63) TaxID=926566 RepID=I3ZM55_TERRK|nr:DNA-3-methyladenine glycosylase [Terriglobus roseus]AFL90323.1 DNA-3-methyladenine glycosylase [Terriglobus roseus DSM 18391]
MKRADNSKLLSQTFYNRSPEVVAKELLGMILVRHYAGERLTGRIVETEAYLGAADPASHAARAVSPFNAVLFGPPGFADIYLIYGLHYCMNVSCLPDGEPGGVLFRAIIPLEGIDTMAALRNLKPNASAKALTGGPARLCQAMGITRASSHGQNMASASSDLQILDDGYRPKSILTTPRIGIKKAVDLPLRFLVDDREP